jgi:branched-chain amino acid transport system permease protein
MFLQQIVNAISLGSVYALFALGFTLIFGILRVINLSHGTVFMLGSYISLMLMTAFKIPLYFAALGGMLFSGILGLIINITIFKPLRDRNSSHLAPMVATIGVAILLTSLVQGLFGVENQRFPIESISAITSIGWDIGDVYITLIDILTIIITLLLTAALLFLITHTKQGKALRAIAENKRSALLLGINVEGLFSLISFCAGFLGGAAGILFGITYSSMSPFMGQSILDKGIAIIILGGMGDIRGALIGGLFLGFVEVFSVAYISSGYKDAISFGLLFLILLIKPSGIFGKTLERKD